MSKNISTKLNEIADERFYRSRVRDSITSFIIHSLLGNFNEALL